MRESFRWQIPLVILPIDEFTGDVIKDPSLEVSVEGAKKPLIKPEGFRVFMTKVTGTGHLPTAREITDEEITVTLRGSVYQEMKVLIAADRIEGKNPVVEIGMKPDRSYPFPPGTLYIEGTLPEHAVLWVAKEGGAGALRLRTDAKSGDDRLHIYQGKTQSLSGSSYLLRGQGEEKREWITCAATEDFLQGIYQLNEPISHDYEHEKAKLYKAVRYDSDMLGEDCFLALPGEPGQKTTICCHVSSYHTIQARGGETLQMDFSQM